MRRIARLVIAALLALGAGNALAACGDDDDSDPSDVVDEGVDEVEEGVDDVEEGVEEGVDDAEDELDDGSDDDSDD